jgi:RNA polymerase sigma factor (sigma-70 family)
MTVTDGADSCPAGDANRLDTDAPIAPDLANETDVELLRLVRAGHDAAFGELFERHAAAVRGFAMRCCTGVADAEDMAAEAFFRVLQAVRRGAGPEDNVRAYLLTVVRRLAAEWSLRRRDVPVADDELSRQLDAGYAAPASRADLQLITRAFTSLPQRWRAVLWRVEVEGERPAVVAAHFGLSANATAALARRARQGLQAAYLQAHLAPTGGATGCRSVVDKLGAFTAGQVTGAEAGRIREHLTGCPTCQALYAELLDVCAGLRRYAGALTPPALGAAVGGHHALFGKAGMAAGRLAGHVAAAAARMKLVVAAVSMAAVGGFGVVAGPIITHLDPSPNADRGIVVGPALLSSSRSGSSAAFDGSVAHGTAGGAFDPPPRSTSHDRQAQSGTVAAAGGAPVSSTGGASPTSDSASEVTTSSDAPSVQRQVLQSSTTTDPVPLSSTPTGGRQVVVNTTTAASDTVWSTSWTTNGTTVYEWWTVSHG